MTTVVTLKNSKFVLPKQICEQAHLYKGKKVIIEMLKNNIIKIKPFKKNSADEELKRLLKCSYHMGKVLVKSREDIYDDID